MKAARSIAATFTSRAATGALAVVPWFHPIVSDVSFPKPTPQKAAVVQSAPGEKGGIGLAIKTRKALTVPLEGVQFVDNAVVLVKDGKIVAVGPAATTAIPNGFQVLDVGEHWVMPGMIDLHSHAGGSFDYNEPVYLTNPGLRASTLVVPLNDNFAVALAGGVTTVLFIPGSSTNIGGQGVLLKTGHERYEDALVRAPGSLKLAQAGNPERWTIGVGRSFMNWNTRSMFQRGTEYARRWEAYEQDGGPKPERNFDLDVFRDLVAGKTQISTHTQIYQVVMTTLTMVRQQFRLPVYIDHGEFGGSLLAGFAAEIGVNAIIGPRNVEIPTRPMIDWTGTNPEAIVGIAADYQKRGMKMIGFNTDSPAAMPPEELSLQAAMAERYGMDASNLETVRGLTIVPAVTAGIDDRLGSIEPGKDADLLIVTGDPADPRSSVERVLVDGKRVYDTAQDKRRF
jgi:imidazolonepropionase-like amidohydrolase